MLADADDSPDEDCIDDDNSSDLEDGELEVDKKGRKIFPDEDDCEGIDDSDEDEEEESLEDDDYANEDDDSAKRSDSSKDKDETEIQDKLIEATLKQEAEKAKAEEKKD